MQGLSTRRLRALALVLVTAVWAAQIGAALTAWLHQRLGSASADEVRGVAAWPGVRALSADLGQARTLPHDPQTWAVALDEAWVRGRYRLGAPLVYLDGQRVAAFLEAPPVRTADEGAIAFYHCTARRQCVLAVRCGLLRPCRTLLAVRQDGAFTLALRLSRLGHHLYASLSAVLLLAGFVALVASVLRAVGTAALVLVSSLATLLGVAWLGGWGAGPEAPLLPVAEALAAGAGLAWTRRDSVAEVWHSRAAPRLTRLAQRLDALAARSRLSRWAGWVCTAAAASLFLPSAVRGRTFFIDWANHLYYVARQAEQLRELGHPSYFLHSDLSGAFYPYYAFYGGTLYALTAALGVLVGSAPVAYVLSIGAGFAMAYWGTAWLSRQMGLSPALAHLPALVLVTSAYYLTNPYGRGSWAELLASSALPLLVAAATALATSTRVRPRDGVLFYLACVLYSGSHTITLVWGGLFLALIAPLGAFLAHATGLALRPRRLGLVALLGLVGLASNAWFLVPALVYGRATHIGAYSAKGFGSDTLFLNTPAVLFHPGRFVPAECGTPRLYVQVSIYILAWVILATLAHLVPLVGRRRAAVRGTRPSATLVPWLTLWSLLGLYVWLIWSGRLDVPWLFLPRVLKIIQFHFRLHTYLTFCVVGLVICGLGAVRRSPHRPLWLAGLALALAVQLGLAEYQVWRAETYHPIGAIATSGVRVPPTLTEAHDYRFLTTRDGKPLGEPVLPEPPRVLAVDPASVQGDRLELAWPAQTDGERALVRVAYSPFIHASGGLAIAGRTDDGWTVLEARYRAPALGRGAIEPAAPWPVKVGVAVSLASLCLALGLTLGKAVWPGRAKA